MKEREIKKYAELMKELELTGLEIEEGGTKIRLERNASAQAYIAAPAAAQPQKASSGKSDGKSSGAAAKDAVKSPMVGVFYAAPREDADPYVSLGDHVNKGDTLCIIEAMKLMNEVAADRSGEIVEIYVQNGAVVEFGTPLFRIKED